MKLVESHELARRTAEDRAGAYEQELAEHLARTVVEKEELVRKTLERAVLKEAEGVLPALQNKIASLEKVVSHLTSRLQKVRIAVFLRVFEA